MTPAASLLLQDVFGVEGRVAAVTGGSSVIGLLAAQTLATTGAHVVVLARDGDRVDAAGRWTRGRPAEPSNSAPGHAGAVQPPRDHGKR